ncbi:redoxin domain-containing protein [Bryobacter aggregatus]|uniref:redoxin domain-containing protein n=1 Tax=Bryobacter aggregatus TaxID=360054 RepID=UPI0004E0BED0|nr:redoxin domain-containing protein [Bryobacter aggregatus]
MITLQTGRRLATVAALLCFSGLYAAAEKRLGHSQHGEVFDSGPRTKPVAIPEIGEAHFPITHKNPETQKWFDQGNALLHSFWEYEAERSFRWCAKLEPDNAMCYWGMARAAGDERSAAFLKEAVKRKAGVSDRERLYIEALEARERIDRLRDHGPNYRDRALNYQKKLETLCVRYPDDMEAKLLLALSGMGDARYGTELILREVEAKLPNHPAVHHYRIHNWNYHEPEMALQSAARYGAIAPNVGHGLHMPGHIYSTVGMWNEAAIAMDAATRTEVRHMHERQVYPFNYWNWGHNRAYLTYIQEQLGLPDLAIAGAKELIQAPQDPSFNGDKPYSPHSQGIHGLARVLVKYERWKELLDTRSFPWREGASDKLLKAYVEARAHFGLGNLEEAEKAIAELDKFEKDKSVESHYAIMSKELRARLALAQNETLLGLGLLTEAAEKQFELQNGDNDPPHYPQVLLNALGDAYLQAGSKNLAIAAYEKALQLTRNDRFALAGLARAGKPVQPVLPASERDYLKADLARFGPKNWTPIDAPVLDAADVEGKRVQLSELKGKNVVLVFYLGSECPHCLKQLRDLKSRNDDWKRLDTVVLAVSGNSAAQNKALLGDAAYQGIRFLGDETHANAKRFLAFDDFEEMELHATLLIDTAGKLRWGRVGGAPFEDMGFLIQQVEGFQR